jgi:glycosyltransferase involved in cell wall biosynthesis
MGYIANFLPEFSVGDEVEVAILTSLQSLDHFESNESLQTHIIKEEYILCQDIRTGVWFYFTKFHSFSTGHFAKSLDEILDDFCPNAIQSLVITTNILNLQLARLARRNNSRFFLQDHSSTSVFNPNRRGKIWHFIFRHFLIHFINNSITACFYPSPDIRNVLVNEYGIRESLLEYQPLGTNSVLFHSPSKEEILNAKNLKLRLNIPESHVIFLYAGRFTRAKGLDILLHAFSLLNESYSDVWLVLIGDNLEPEILNHYQFLRNLTVLSKVKAKDLPYYYWMADFGVWPREGSTSIIDAIYCGLPVIVRNGITEPERRAYPQLIFQDESVDSLAKSMRLASDSYFQERVFSPMKGCLELIMDWRQIASMRNENFYFGS